MLPVISFKYRQSGFFKFNQAVGYRMQIQPRLFGQLPDLLAFGLDQ